MLHLNYLYPRPQIAPQVFVFEASCCILIIYVLDLILQLKYLCLKPHVTS